EARRFFFQAEDGIRDRNVTGVQTCALPIWMPWGAPSSASTFASWASAALAAEYAAKSLPGAITFLVATKTSAPPIPCAIITRIRSEERRVGRESGRRGPGDRDQESVRSVGR